MILRFIGAENDKTADRKEKRKTFKEHAGNSYFKACSRIAFVSIQMQRGVDVLLAH